MRPHGAGRRQREREDTQQITSSSDNDDQCNRSGLLPLLMTPGRGGRGRDGRPVIWILLLAIVFLNLLIVIQSSIHFHSKPSSTTSSSLHMNDHHRRRHIHSQGQNQRVWPPIEMEEFTAMRRNLKTRNSSLMVVVPQRIDNATTSRTAVLVPLPVKAENSGTITMATNSAGIAYGNDRSSANKDDNNNNNVTNIPVFYNLYVSTEDDRKKIDINETDRVLKLVIDQLEHHLDRQIHYPVYVNSIGRPLRIPDTIQLAHYKEGQETLTLHSLWRHCQIQKDQPNARVVYLHSKGALHNHERNDRLRDFVTAGATSPKCTDNLVPETCDVCSIRFTPFPHPHVSGNMWSARCQYIAQLPNPLEFEDLMETVPRVHTAKQPYYVGRRRFAAEHWVYSHPIVLPCDVYTGRFTCGYKGAKSKLRDDVDVRWSAAPRFQLDYFRGDTKKDRDLEYWTGLDARLEEYKILYNQTPSENWWGWKLNAWVEQDQRKQQQSQESARRKL